MTSPHNRPLRFGLVVFTPATRAQWVAKVRLAESLGYDVVSVSDHLGMPAPLATLALVAEATERIRIGTLVLNTSFYNPTVLARDIATVDHYAGGRLEIGLGAGYDKAQFDRAGLPWIGARERVDHLERTVRELRKVLTSPQSTPPPAQPGGPPILIAGRGPRVLRLAAEHADIVGFTGTAPVRDGDGLRLGGPQEIKRRIADVHALLGERAKDVELNIPVHRVLPSAASAASGAVTDVWQNELDLGAADLAELPSFLIGSPKEAADQLLERRRRYGLSYFSVLEPEMEAVAKVIEEVR